MTIETFTVWVGAIVTLCVFSYVLKDNAAYRFVQQATLGTYMGMFIVITWNQVLHPRWWSKVADGAAAFGGGAADDRWQVLWALALLPGLLWYFQLSKRLFWVSTLISGLFVGVAAGLAFKTQILLIMPQISATIRPVLAWFSNYNSDSNIGVFEVLNHTLLVLLLLVTLFYFLFSVKADHPLLGRTMRFGRIAIMVCLGALFGNTVLTRVAYLIERLLFLTNDWILRTILQQPV